MEFKINENFKIINDNSKLMLKYLKEDSIDAIVCDPPYELGFMNKKWDGTGIAYDIEFWQQCLKVLKPGGYLLAFGGSRTYHRMACAIEDAGFELRDTIMWLYGSGFPKSHNVSLSVDKKLGCPNRGHRIATASRYHPDGTFEPNGENLPPYESKTEEGKKWTGYGTCLKPAFEPIIMARKPLEGSVAENVLKYGVGAINIDECRVATEEIIEKGRNGRKEKSTFQSSVIISDDREYQNNGRFPANVITDGSDDVSKDMFDYETQQNACRYFYCAKASKKDRDEGLDEFEAKIAGSMIANIGITMGLGGASLKGEPKAIIPKRNIHPSVKPTELMQYLVRLVAPKGATILDPFNGSGSTGKAVAFENRERQANYKYIGFELEKEYVDISIARINFALNQYEYEAKKEEKETGQMRLF